VGDLLRDYANIFPVAVAVINGALAALSANYPFKTARRKIIFIVAVLSLSFGAVAADIYAQHLVIGQRDKERAQRSLIREQLGVYIAEGSALMDQCADRSRPPPVGAANEWISRVTLFLAGKLGASYIARFHDHTGISSMTLPGADSEHENVWFGIYRRVLRLEQFSQELPAS
jgi:hypothetical protein